MLDKFNDSSAIVVKNETDELHIHTLDATDYTREPNKFRLGIWNLRTRTDKKLLGKGSSIMYKVIHLP